MLLVIDSIGVVASLMGLCVPLYQLWKGVPSTPQQSRRLARNFVLLSVFATILLISLSFRLQNSIETYEQSERFQDSQSGEFKVYYKVPYASPPNLKVDPERPGQLSPQIGEQYADHFTASTALGVCNSCSRWIATGIPKH